MFIFKTLADKTLLKNIVIRGVIMIKVGKNNNKVK